MRFPVTLLAWKREFRVFDGDMVQFIAMGDDGHLVDYQGRRWEPHEEPGVWHNEESGLWVKVAE